MTVDEREDIMSDEICRRNNGKQGRRRGGRSVQLPDWVLNKIKRQDIIVIFSHYNAVHGHKAGSNNSGVEAYLTRKTSEAGDNTYSNQNK